LGERSRKHYPLNRDKLNEILPDAWTCEDAKARRELGYAPAKRLEAGMLETIRWYRSQGWLKS
jgi:nucleoside-diphosphate-sugar epimerase